MGKVLRTVATKMVVQMTTKQGAIPWSVHNPLKGKLAVAGFDTYHDSQNNAKSWGAFVGTLDDDFGRYYSSVVDQESRQELASQMRVLFATWLRIWAEKNNGKYP